MAPPSGSVSRSFLPQRDKFLVCGLGSLGQHCVANLKTFGVSVSAVELSPPNQWEIPTLPDLLDQLLIGDCRHAEVLEQAGVRQCRVVLLVTTNERVNLEAALTARVLNPGVRLVVRSEKQNLNDLLEQQLENFVAFEPTQLAAPAFALEAFGEELIGFFKLENYRFRVIKETIHSHHRWCDRRMVHEVDGRDRRVLRHLNAEIANLSPEEQATRLDNPYSPSAQFYTWLPNSTIRCGDVMVTVEAESEEVATLPKFNVHPAKYPLRALQASLKTWRSWSPRQSLKRFWQASYKQQIQRVALLCGLTVVLLCVVGTVLLTLTGLSPNGIDAFYATVVLLLGGYGDMFSDFALDLPIPWWLRLFSLGLTLAGTAFIGVLYALLTEKLLALKFDFLAKRPPVPEKGHVVVIWLGRVGRQIVQMLQDLNQTVVGVTNQTIEPDVLPQMPLISGRIVDGLENANLATAKSVVAVSDDEMQNLELGLMAHRINPHCRLIIRTYDQLLTDKVAQLFPYAQVLCASALSAEAFTGAAFGENVVSLFRLYHQTVLVTQYTIETGDTLHDLLLADIAYGYGVSPIWHQRADTPPKLMPADDIRLQEGDSLIVLATIRGLRRIEQGDLAPKQWQIEVEQVFSADAEFEGASEIARLTGCSIGEARSFITHLPAVFPHRLYRHQALRLVRLLIKSRVKARVMPLADRARPAS